MAVSESSERAVVSSMAKSASGDVVKSENSIKRLKNPVLPKNGQKKMPPEQTLHARQFTYQTPRQIQFINYILYKGHSLETGKILTTNFEL